MISRCDIDTIRRVVKTLRNAYLMYCNTSISVVFKDLKYEINKNNTGKGKVHPRTGHEGPEVE